VWISSHERRYCYCALYAYSTESSQQVLHLANSPQDQALAELEGEGLYGLRDSRIAESQLSELFHWQIAGRQILSCETWNETATRPYIKQQKTAEEKGGKNY
jgi:hypothetical protein